jgi:hypothetical protein
VATSDGPPGDVAVALARVHLILFGWRTHSRARATRTYTASEDAARGPAAGGLPTGDWQAEGGGRFVMALTMPTVIA